MTPNERLEAVCRILSEYTQYTVGQTVFYLRVPSAQTVYEANILYNKVLYDLRFTDWYNSETILGFLENQEIPCWENVRAKQEGGEILYQWSVDMQKQMDEFVLMIDNLKVELFNWGMEENDTRISKTRDQLKAVQKDYNRLHYQKHSADVLTAEHVATVVYLRTLYSQTLYDEAKKKIEDPDPLIVDLVAREAGNEQLTISDLREIARTEPWHTRWTTLKPNPFEGYLTDERCSLAHWSRFYDNVEMLPDSPPDHIIEDDDMLDGWAIKRRRDREAEEKKSREPIIRDGRDLEVFLFAPTREAANKIYEKNSPSNRSIIKDRFKAIEQRGGSVKDHELPDQHNKITKELAKRQISRSNSKITTQ